MNSKSVRERRRIDLEVLNLPVPKLYKKRPSGIVDCFFIQDCKLPDLGLWDLGDSEIWDLGFWDLGILVKTNSARQSSLSRLWPAGVLFSPGKTCSWSFGHHSGDSRIF